MNNEQIPTPVNLVFRSTRRVEIYRITSYARYSLPHVQRAKFGVLSKRYLKKKQWQTDQEKHNYKSDHERRAAVFEAEIRKSKQL